MSVAGELIRRITPILNKASMNFSCRDQKCSEFNCGHYGTKMESVRPSCQKLYFGQTGKFRSPHIFWPALESFVLPLSTTYLKTKRADGFAEECYFIKFRPLTKRQKAVGTIHTVYNHIFTVHKLT